MRLKRGNLEIDTVTLPNQKRPSLLITRERNLHSKVGMMMDDERAAEFMFYLAEMIGAKIEVSKSDGTDSVDG